MKAQICIPEIYSGLYSEFVWFCPDIDQSSRFDFEFHGIATIVLDVFDLLFFW